MRPVHIHQIHYDDTTRAALDPAFTALDNRANPRPDWREYWPMRQALLGPLLDDEVACYGFVSPKFGAKTGLSGAQAIAFAAGCDTDVVVLSPYVEQSSFFLNLFEHGEANHPGLLPAMQGFADLCGLGLDLKTTVCDHHRSVFSNFFVARPRFWRAWLQLGERLFALCETGSGPLADTLRATATYHAASGPVPVKVFVMERLASLLLVTGNFTSRAYDPFALTRSGIPASYLDDEMRTANAFKMAFLGTGDARYIESFYRTRNAVLGRR